MKTPKKSVSYVVAVKQEDASFWLPLTTYRFTSLKKAKQALKRKSYDHYSIWRVTDFEPVWEIVEEK